ncbi:peptide MFS transporter [Gluconacetobacter tumulisoli]|uniref:Peptide MFS transporter n=2 Tax=Gluconacetobacter tumulisoli TaxID=1286189 RepID=A0A7W4K8L5_9PROT|nr:peptide MFS transporter [Gluconacetobacter tumulisoli]
MTGRATSPRALFGHPPGLMLLFLVEMWERFSFYGMRTLLIVYLTAVVLPDAGHVAGYATLCALLHLDPATAGPVRISSELYGLYSGCVYLTPLLGGLLADRLFGKRATIIAGGALIVAGHLLLTTRHWFLAALLLVVIGTGGVKGNIAAQVADLYEPGDPRRERGFSIFYVGINVGATAAPIVCSALAGTLGWNAAFMATSIGMIAGLALYAFGAAHLPDRQAPDPAAAAPARTGGGSFAILAVLTLAATFLWISYEQQANALVRWMAASPSDMGLAWLQAIPPAMVLCGTPLLTRHWSARARAGREPGPGSKMLIGAAIVLVMQLLLAVLSLAGGGKAPPGWVVALYFAGWEIGDLYFSPAAMGVFSRLARPGFEAVTMAVWYLTVFAGNIASGWIGGMWGSVGISAYWFIVAALTAVGVAGMAVCRPLIARAPHAVPQDA